MKVVLLAGGLGTRISEETALKPKPLVEIGGRPILWHIMKSYSSFGFHDFIVCCGYKGYMIKEYFSNYFLHNSDVTFDMVDNSMIVHSKKAEPWKVTLVDTGEQTQTGGRLLRVRQYLGKDTFCFTYGDGLSNIDLSLLVKAHKDSGALATVSAVIPPARYGALDIDENGLAKEFMEKPPGDGGLINGGFFVLSRKVLNYISGDSCSWENDCLPSLVEDSQLNVFEHRGFWHAMDTLRDKNQLEKLWNTNVAPWRSWAS